MRVPPPEGRSAAGCHRLAAALPDEVGGGERRDTAPESRRTAAWGDPAVVLRCGVSRPAALVPTAQLLEVNGVDWVLAERPSHYVFTTAGRRAYVEVRVPAAIPREAATGPLVDVAAAVRSTVPRE